MAFYFFIIKGFLFFLVIDILVCLTNSVKAVYNIDR